VDTAGNRPVSRLRRALAPRGTLAIVGDEAQRERLLWGFGRQLAAPLVSVFGHQKLRSVMSVVRADDLEILRALVEAGKLTPIVDRTFSLAGLPEAIRYLEQGHPRGKVVVKV
jgi:NADPH:quinone reductase-like Zn-dependent oxidoreductase